nr:MAG TPA: hypothetical protein [Caudoviricetes sp.]
MIFCTNNIYITHKNIYFAFFIKKFLTNDFLYIININVISNDSEFNKNY